MRDVCIRLAKSNDLNTLLTKLKNDCIDEMLSSAPDQQEQREAAYTRHRLYDDLAQYVDEQAGTRHE